MSVLLAFPNPRECHTICVEEEKMRRRSNEERGMVGGGVKEGVMRERERIEEGSCREKREIRNEP